MFKMQSWIDGPALSRDISFDSRHAPCLESHQCELPPARLPAGSSWTSLVSRICPAWMACMFGKSEQESYKPRFNPTDPQSAQSAKGRALAVSLLDKEH